MDLELPSLLPLPPRHSQQRRGLAGVCSRQPSEIRACDLTVCVKESLIVFGNVLFIGWMLLTSVSDFFLAKTSLSDNTVQNVEQVLLIPSHQL